MWIHAWENVLVLLCKMKGTHIQRFKLTKVTINKNNYNKIDQLKFFPAFEFLFKRIKSN